MSVHPSLCLTVCLSVFVLISLSVKEFFVVCLLSLKFVMQIEVDECYVMICHVTQSKVKVKVTRPSNLDIIPHSNSISFAIYNGADK